MNTKALTPQIKASYITAIFAYAFALYVVCKVEGAFGLSVAAMLAAASLWLVTAATFRWGSLVGYPVYDQDKKFSFEHFLRNGVMTALVIISLSFIGLPVFALVGWLITKK